MKYKFTVAVSLFYIFVFCMSLFLLTQCSKDDNMTILEEENRIIKERTTLLLETEESKTEKKPKYITYCIDDSIWEVGYKDYTNMVHINGYVVITNIFLNTTRYFLKTTASNYIESIHDYRSEIVYQKMCLDYYGDEVKSIEDVNLGEEEFLGVFRTGETILMAYFMTSNNPVNHSDVLEAKRLMEGRKYGFPRR